MNKTYRCDQTLHAVTGEARQTRQQHCCSEHNAGRDGGRAAGSEAGSAYLQYHGQELTQGFVVPPCDIATSGEALSQSPVTWEG